MTKSKLTIVTVIASINLLGVIGCDWMTDYPHNEEATERSDMYKTGSGVYGGTDKNQDPGHTMGTTTYDGTNPAASTSQPSTEPH